jgi:hypothetical protein
MAAWRDDIVANRTGWVELFTIPGADAAISRRSLNSRAG